MSPENQNFGQVESGQQRLETVRASADSPQALQQKLQDYRATYQTEVNRQKTSLTNFAATFDSASAKDFVLESAGKLGGKMVELAQEGESLQRASIKNKQDKGEPLTEKELNFQTLASLKATLQNEMGRQRVELGNLRKLHQLDAEYSQTMKADNKANERVTVTGIPAAITAKAAQYETMARVIQDLSALPASPTYDQDRTTLIKQIGLFRSSLALDQQSGQTFLQVKEKATLAKADLKKLQTKISGKKPLTQEEYQTLNNELQQAFGNVGDTEAKSNEVMGRGSFLKNLDYDGFKATNLTPLWDNLLTLRGQLEAKNPQSKDTEKTEETTEEQESGKDLLLQAAEAREQLSVKKDQIQQVVKYLKNLKRDPKQYLNHEEFVKLGKDIAELQGEAEALQTKYQINTRAADKEPNTRLLFQRLQSNDYQPTLAAAQALMELNLARESAIKDLGNKLFNAEVEKLIPRLKESWATGIEGQKAYLETPPTYDEKDPNFKAYQEGERTLLTNLIACESQVNFVLSRQDSGLPEGNKLILERYRTLSQEYQTKIQSNRAHRHLLRAVREGQGQDQDHAHEVKVGTRERFDGENSFNEDITEQRRANYKFHECVRFLDPNDPKYQEINGGRGWEFIKQDLPKDIQDRFALNAAKIVTDSRHEAEAEMFRDKQKILTENKLFDRTKEDLGEQAKDYFAAGEAMAIGDIPKALAAYNKYLEISKTFSQEELDKHKHYLEDARRQVESVANSAEFYEAMHLMKDGQLDNALPKFRAYIERIKKLPKEEQKTFAEQLNAATEIMRKINSTKMSMLVELKNDLKYLSAIQTARNVGTKRDNIMAELKKLQQNSHALSRGEKPPFADADIDLDPVRRDLLLPYIPYDQLTTQEKIKINEGGGGLTGPDVTDLEDSIKKLEQRIEDGEPVDFEKEMTAIKEKMAGNADPKNYPLAATYTGPNGQQRVETPSARLFDMFDKINSTDPKEREKGFVYIADQFKSAEAGMQYTQKYLRKAMNYQYEQWGKDDGDKTQKEVMKKMLADKNVASDVLKGAKEYYRRYAEEENAKNPGQEAAVPLDPPDPIILQRFQSQIFEQQFRFQYEREVRKKMTNLGMASTDSALQRYNVSLPYETVDGAWYKPWNWSDCNEDQWNDVKSELAVFAVETIVTMPIGMGAGAIGRAVGSGVLKALARQGLKAEAIALIEKGGIMALRNSSHIWEGVSPALKQSIMASRGKIMASWGAGLAAEGTSMLLMNSIWEGLSTGRNPEIFRQLDAGEWKNVSLALLENIGKAGVFRAMGAAQGRLMTGMGAGVESSATRNMLAHVVGETASGSLGTGLEALVMLAKGQGAQITTEFWVRSLVQNSLQSYGTHVAHGGFKKPQFLIDREQARYKAIEKEMDTQRLARPETQTATDIQSPRLGDNASPYRTPAEITPSAPGVERRGAPKPPEVSTTESPSPNLQPAEAPTPRPALRPAPELPQSHLKPEEVRARVDRLQPDLQLLMDRESLDHHEAGPAEQTAADAKIAERAREMGLTPDEFRFRTVSEAKLLNSIGALDNSERQFYGESKIVKKPVLNEDGSPKLDANRQPVYENVNLFANYESKSSAYSRELLRGLSYEQLQAQGGGKVIKLGGDELLVFHAGPDGTVQKLFVDISNMGPTNDTATNIAGGKINLVDVYLHRVSEAILAQSKAQQGKLLDPAAFNAEVSRVADSLFNLDLGPDGQPLKTEEARARFEKLQKEWNLEGTFAEYFTDVRSMRILAEYRSDTRFLDSSYDPSSGVPFEVHIASEIQNISGLKVAELQQLIASNSKAFEAMVKDHLPKSPKIKAKTVEQLMEEISSIKPDSAKPEDLMMLYALMARADISQIAPNSPLRPLADRLSVSRTEMVGDPPHRRVMEPRLMDAKVVSIEIPPDLAKALSALAETDPVYAQAILAAARKMAEKPLDGLKYQTEPGFAEFRIGDHVAVRDGKIHIRDEGGEFGREVKANENDKKLTNVIDAEDSLRIARSRLESLRQELLDGKIDKPAFDAEMVKAEAEISKLEEKILTDPDTLAFSQAYMDVTPTRMFSFDNGTINAQYRVWNSAVTELGHSGAINAKYGYAVMDQIMTAYHQQLQKGISAVLPPNLQHFKIIRSGGGKFEVIFLDSRAVAHLADQGLTPQSLVAKIAGDSGQAIVNRTLSADPAKLAAAKRDAAVRNSQFKYNKGTDMVELGQLSTRAETTIATSAITRVQKENPNASSRVMLGMARPPAATAPEASAQSRENTPPPSEGPIAALGGNETLSFTMRKALSDIEALDAYTKKEHPYLPADDPEFRKLESTQDREAYLLAKLKEFQNQILYDRTDNATQLKINELAELLVGGTIKHGDQRLQITLNMTGVDGLPPDWQTRVINISKASYEAGKTNILVLKSPNAGEPDSYLLINSEAVKEIDHYSADPTADKNRAVFQLHNELRTTLRAINDSITNTLREAQQSRINHKKGEIDKAGSAQADNSRKLAEAKEQRSILNNSYSRSLLEFGRGLRTDAEIQKLPPEERRQVIAERIRTESERMRVYIQNKKQTISEISDFLFARRKADPTLSAEAIKGMFDAQARERQLSLTAEEKQYIDKVIAEIAQKQVLVDDYFLRYKDKPEQLFADVFGFQPTGKIELVQSDFSINFRLHAKEDVAQIYSQITNETFAEGTMGFNIPTSRIRDLSGLVNIIRADAKQVFDLQTVIRHEERHALNRTLLPDNLQYALIVNSVYNAESLHGLRQVYRHYLEASLKRAQDEISAYQEQGESPKEISAVLTADGDIYDYWASLRDKTRKSVLKNLIGKQRDGETIADYEQRKQRTELEVDTLYNEYRNLHNRRAQEMVIGAFETPHPVMNVLQTPTQLQRAGRQAQKRVATDSEARPPAATAPEASAQSRESATRPDTRMESTPGGKKAFYRYNERLGRDGLVRFDEATQHWHDERNQFVKPPTAEELTKSNTDPLIAPESLPPPAYPPLDEKAFFRVCVDQMDQGGEAFLRWKEQLQDPAQFAYAERVQATDRQHRIQSAREQFANVQTLVEAWTIINRINSEKTILPGTSWEIITNLPGNKQAVILGIDGQLHLFNNTHDQYNYALLSARFKASFRKWEGLDPETRVTEIKGQCDLINSQIATGELPTTARDRILAKASPEVRDVILSPTPEKIRQLPVEQLPALRAIVLKLRNEGLRSTRSQAREKARVSMELAAFLENTMRAELKANPQLTREELYQTMDLENNAQFRDTHFSDMEKAKIRFIVDSLFEKSKAIQTYYSRFKDNPKQLFREVFGHDPVGDVKIGTSDFSLYFECLDTRDFVAVTGGDARAEALGFGRSRIDSLDGMIVVSNNSPATTRAQNARPFREVILHEEQHNINKYVIRALQPEYHKWPELDLDGITDPQQRQAAIRQYHDRLAENYLILAKDEVLAFMKNGESFDSIAKKFQTGGSYDFWSREIKEWQAQASENSHGQTRLDETAITEALNTSIAQETNFHRIMHDAVEAARRINDPSLLLITDIRQWAQIATARTEITSFIRSDARSGKDITITYNPALAVWVDAGGQFVRPPDTTELLRANNQPPTPPNRITPEMLSSRVAEGPQPINPAQRTTLEQATATNPREAFRRDEVAAKAGTEAPTIEVSETFSVNRESPAKAVESIVQGLDSPGSKPFAADLMQRLIKLAQKREKFPDIVRDFSYLPPGLIPTIANQLNARFQKNYDSLSDSLARAKREGQKSLTEFDRKLTREQREYVRLILAESGEINQLLSRNDAAGVAKTPARQTADYNLIIEQIRSGKTRTGRYLIETLLDAGTPGKDLLPRILKETTAKQSEAIRQEILGIYNERILSNRLSELTPEQISYITTPGQVPMETLGLLARDSQKAISGPHLDALLKGQIDPARLAILEANLQKLSISPELVGKIIDSPKLNLLTPEQVAGLTTGRVPIEVLSLIVSDTNNTLNPSQVNRLINLQVLSERVEIISAIMGRPGVGSDFIERVINGKRLSSLTRDQIDLIKMGEVPLQLISIAANDQREILTSNQLDFLINNNVDPESLRILEKNLNHRYMSTDLAEKIIHYPPEVISLGGRRARFFDAEEIKSGGFGRVFRAAIIESDGTLTYIGCKHSATERGAQVEAETVNRMRDLESRYLNTANIMRYRGYSDETPTVRQGEYTFFELHDFMDASGRVIRGDVDMLAQDTTVPEQVLYQTVLGGGKALVAFEQAGMIQMDPKLDNYVVGQDAGGKPKGIHIDLGFVRSREEVINAPMNPGRAILDNYDFIHVPSEIGVTPGYYSYDLFNLIQRGILPPERYHNYTFGVSIEGLVTGTLNYPRQNPANPDSPTPESVVAYNPRPLPVPPYAVDANARLLDLAGRLKSLDPENTLTMAQAVAEFENITKLP